MCSFLLVLFTKTTKDKHTKPCCVTREHCCAVSIYFNIQKTTQYIKITNKQQKRQ